VNMAERLPASALETQIRVEVLCDPVAEHIGFDVAHPYVELVWLPVIGPTSTLVLRRLGSHLGASPGGYDLDLDSLAVEMGLGAHAGRHSPLLRSLERLVRFGLARWRGASTYELRTSVPPVPARLLAHLPESLTAAHRQLTGEHSRPRNALLSAALEYAGRGWPVIPLRPAQKVPDGALVPHGLREASCDEGRIEVWWRASPTANVGIRTGDAVDVIDVDGPAAKEALLAEVPGAFDEALVAKTGRGWHLYFATSGLSSRAAVLEGLDVRGRGGYVVAPPSAHPAGGRYHFVDFATGEELTTAPKTLTHVPPALAELCTRREPPRVMGPISIRTGVEAYARRALEDECSKLASSGEGGRNDRLNRAAFAMGTLVGAKALRASDAAGALFEAAQRCGLSEHEARRTIASGLNAGIERPRHFEDRRPEEPTTQLRAPARSDRIGAVLAQKESASRTHPSAPRTQPRPAEGRSR